MADRSDEHTLNALFAAAQAETPEPSADLMARIMADAASALPSVVPQSRKRSGWQAGLVALGGWRALVGLGAATMAGLTFGLFMPETLTNVTGGYLSGSASATSTPGTYSLSDLGGSFYDLMDEG